MQMQDLVKPISQCTDEELLIRIRTIRANRTTIRPAAKTHAKKAAKKGQQGRMSVVEKMMASMSEADRQAFIAELEGMQ